MTYKALSGLDSLWATPIRRVRYVDAQSINPVLAALFQQERLSAGAGDASVFSSSDDLLIRYDDPVLKQLFQFISQTVFELAAELNGDLWQQSPSLRMNMNVVGAWFQIQNGGAFHDVHSHGNCSWSGVYYVQADDDEVRREHPVYGALNGVTRFYGPQTEQIAGAYMDSGNLYLQRNSWDSLPEPGVLCVFPSHLKHMALPYQGQKDRIILSFNAQVHGDQGDGVLAFSMG
ncbi:putative 2OG-Fe(II) oxygenase [Saccharospirillum impatiens]|uniref:putative 2OG-Fe(II) oxygenase n=1 Tax=Saccharospirillum impatiens TaxID=169438 RepID=UPI00040BA3E2|nr:putative 2OG-Fe(II) oxygenase [Saccharospirillum impatiens]